MRISRFIALINITNIAKSTIHQMSFEKSRGKKIRRNSRVINFEGTI